MAIFIMVISAVWAFKHQEYALMVGALLVIAVFVYLKIQLLKSVKLLQNSKGKLPKD